MSKSNFYPVQPPQNLSASATSATTKLTATNPQLDIVVRVVNSGDKNVYLNFGEDGDVTSSSTSGMIVLSKALPEYINLPENRHYLAYACASGETTTLQIVLGRMGK